MRNKMSLAAGKELKKMAQTASVLVCCFCFFIAMNSTRVIDIFKLEKIFFPKKITIKQAKLTFFSNFESNVR